VIVHRQFRFGGATQQSAALRLDKSARLLLQRVIQDPSQEQHGQALQNWNRRPISISRGCTALVDRPKFGEVRTPDGRP